MFFFFWLITGNLNYLIEIQTIHKGFLLLLKATINKHCMSDILFFGLIKQIWENAKDGPQQEGGLVYLHDGSLFQ